MSIFKSTRFFIATVETASHEIYSLLIQVESCLMILSSITGKDCHLTRSNGYFTSEGNEGQTEL